MDSVTLLAAVAGAAVGLLLGWLLGARKVTSLREDLARREAELAGERARSAEKLALLEDAAARLRDAFKALSADALRESQQSFLELAKASLGTFQESARTDLEARQRAIEAIVKPVDETLRKVDQKLQDVEKERVAHQAEIREQIRSLASTHQRLQAETSNLAKALRAPTARGQWGEIQLRRVVELAGMVDHCDFVEQGSVASEEGRLRPDLRVNLPGGKTIIVDAKAPLAAYLEAIDAADDAAREAKLVEHARQVREHMTNLGGKRYWGQFADSPDFVVMFLPGEAFFSTALQHDPALIEYGVSQGVVPASPTTLISILKAVAYGWRQEAIAASAREISELGRQLHERLRTMVPYLAKLGRGLEQAVGAFNETVGSFEARVLSQARKFHELGAASGADIETLGAVEKSPRILTAAGSDEPSDDA